MDREIKFRGKRCADGKWVYGDYVAGDSCDVFFIFPRDITSLFCVGGRYEVDENTVGQFTGQYDKNDKEIYEGDIVRWEYPDYDHCTGWKGTVKNVCKVTFEYGSFRINAYPYNLGKCEDFFEDKETYGLEVIGSIYDNPELLSTK